MAFELPIDEILPDARRILNAHDELILEAPPGAGKTTHLPLALLGQSWLQDGKILLLQPRRVAARAAAERMAYALGEKIGETVGYRIRQEAKVSEKTKIEVITEGILSRQLLSDPSLEGIGLVIFDEFHERSLDSDFGLALCKQTREYFRDQPLKIIVMSASLGESTLATYLNNAPLLKSGGRLHPVDIRYHRPVKYEAPASIDNDLRWLFERVLDAVLHALSSQQGDILVFLPGKREINACLEKLRGLELAHVIIVSLHGSIPVSEQRRVINPLPTKDSPPPRRIILSTDIAETSLTIEGVSTVIDSGLARVSEFDPNTATSRLQTRRISKASSIQRAGRAGRLGPGVCYRLWTQSQDAALVDQRKPEILTADLASLALQAFSWGADSADDFSWLTSPPRGSFEQAVDLLCSLHALKENQGRLVITEHGKQMAIFPTHPRLAHLLINASNMGSRERAANMAAILSERDSLSIYGCDVNKRLEILEGRSRCPPNHRGWLQTVKKQSLRFFALAQTCTEARSQSTQPPLSNGHLAALAYPDRIGKRTNTPGIYKLSNGRTASLAANDDLNVYEWLVALDLGGSHQNHCDKIYRAVALDETTIDTFLSDLIAKKSTSYWDEKTGRFMTTSHFYIGRLKWKPAAKEKASKEEIQRTLICHIKEKGLETLAWDDNCKIFLSRLKLAREYDTCREWPDLTENQLIESVEAWLGPYLENITSLKQLKEIEPLSILKNQLEWSQRDRLDNILPERITVPSGASKAIDYLQSPPVLKVKLQEMFGLASSPRLFDGKIALSVHLLSPAQRPLQITQDLAAFWRNAYQDVKKEMRGRYPKHPWPDDPLRSAATSLTKKRLTKPRP